jgi:hypothetical protein
MALEIWNGTPPRWIAKLRDHTGHHKKSLGQITEDFDYDPAREAAQSWFKSYESGITDESFTVENACKTTWTILASKRVRRALTMQARCSSAARWE